MTAALVEGFRQFTPYVHAHRGCTFVIAFGGEALADAAFPHLVHDLALLHGIGIRLVLVHGARPQIEERLALRGAQLRYVNGVRITDDVALACVKDAAGAARVEIEALLSLGLANSPMAGVRIPVLSGNFVVARPLGVLEGVDYQHTGTVRRIDEAVLRRGLDAGAIVLLPPLGYSPTGEVFNLSAAEVARAVAVALAADKLIFLVEAPGLRDIHGQMPSHLTPDEAERWLEAPRWLSDEHIQTLRAALAACRGQVRRVHIIDRSTDGALLLELFTRDGAGTLVSAEPFEEPRPAQPTDIPGMLALLAPLEQQGVLIRRSRERLENDLDHFHVVVREGMVIACAALYPFTEERMGELACVVVHPEYRARGRGERLLAHMEALARAQGLNQLFVLTTQTAHWFRERGFVPVPCSALPAAKQAVYDHQRNAQAYVKTL